MATFMDMVWLYLLSKFGAPSHDLFGRLRGHAYSYCTQMVMPLDGFRTGPKLDYENARSAPDYQQNNHAQKHTIVS